MNTQLGGPAGHNPLGEYIERINSGLPVWFMPFAIGASIPSDEDLGAAGYRPGGYRPRGWTRKYVDVFCKRIGDHVLWVRGTIDGPPKKLWTAERVGVSNDDDQALTHALCALPTLNRTYQAAMRLGEFCHPHAPEKQWYLQWADQNS